MKQPELGIAGALTPVLQAAWEEQLREIRQASSPAELAEKVYGTTHWLAALVQGRVIASDAAIPLRQALDLARRQAERRVSAEQS